MVNFSSKLLGGVGGISSTVKSRTKKESKKGEVTMWKRVGSLSLGLIECSMNRRERRRGERMSVEKTQDIMQTLMALLVAH